jgi:DNA-binding transcriptional LysR family regulator
MVDTLREIGAVSQGASGHIRVGVAPTMAQFLLPGALRLFLADGEAITMQTIIGMSNFLRNLGRGHVCRAAA